MDKKDRRSEQTAPAQQREVKSQQRERRPTSGRGAATALASLKQLEQRYEWLDGTAAKDPEA